MSQVATKGRIVLYKLDGLSAGKAGGHSYAGDVVPAIIVQVWPDNRVDLKVFSDGPSDVWVTSVPEWDADGVTSPDVLQPQRTYRWPSRS